METNNMITIATYSQISNLRRCALNGVTREISRNGIMMTHGQFDSLGVDVVDWMRNRLKLQISEGSDGVTCTGWALTAETITDKQIRALAEDAQAADPTDYRQIDLCARALTEDGDTQNDDGHDIALADWTKDEARKECARAINSARAMED